MRLVISLFLIVLSLVTIVTALQFNDVEASQNPINVIEIKYSETCDRDLSLNINSTCPPLESLIPFDTSLQMISGHFVKSDNGKMIRENPSVKNNYLFYSFYNQKVVCVECQIPLARMAEFQVIFIEPHNFTFTDVNDSVVNNTRFEYHDRFLNGCISAQIKFTPLILKDTIAYFENNCNVIPKVQTKFSFIVPMNTPPLYNESYTYQMKIALSKFHHLGNCIINNCGQLIPNYKNPFW